MTKEQMMKDFYDTYIVNPLKRSISSNGACLYSSKESKNNGSPGCAIGRYLDEITADNWDRGGSIGSIIKDGNLFRMAPQWMRDMDHYFLEELQSLHDTVAFWEDGYFNELGVKNYNSICSIWNIQVPLLSYCDGKVRILEEVEN